MLKKLLSAALLWCVCASAQAGNTPVTFQIDRTLSPSPVCVLRLTSGPCAIIGYVSAANVWTPTGPGGSTFAPSAYTDTTNASNISSGTLPAARLPAPTTTTRGGVLSAAAPLNQFQTGIDTTGAPTFAQVPFTSLSGQISAAQVPNALALNNASLTGTPNTPGLTGYLYGNGGTGWTASATIPTSALSGTLLAAQFPAITGDFSIPAGSLTGTIQPGAVTSAKMASGAAYGNLAANSVDATKVSQAPAGTLRGNLTGATANVADSTLSAYMDAAFGNPAPRGTVIVKGATGFVARTPTAAGQIPTFDGTDTSFAAPGAAVTLFPGLLFGHTLANNATNPNTSLDIGAGTAASDDASVRMTLASALTKTMSAWAAGGTSASPVGGLDVGSASANFWYHVFSIYNPTTLTTDALLSLSSGLVANQPSAPATISIASPAVITVPNHGIPMYSSIVFSTTGSLPTGITAGTIYYVGPSGYTANSFQITTTQNGTAVATSGTQSGTHTIVATPVMPSGYTKKRRVGSVKVTGTATNFTPFTQLGDQFLWTSVSTDISMASGFGTTAALYTLNVPPGVKVNALFSVTTSTASNNVYVQSPDQSGTQGTSGQVATSTNAWAALSIRTNTASQIQAYSQAANANFYGVTSGWIDTRGK